MEPFRLTPQSIAFVALMAGVTVVVALAAPFGSIALGAVALAAIGAVLIKAMFRTRHWWPLTAVEGTIAVSCLVLVAGGLGVVGYSIVRLGEGWHMTIGWPSAFSEEPQTTGRTSRVMYTDPELQQKVKDGLREAGVPYTTTTREGKEYIGWPPEHNEMAEAVIEKIVGPALPNDRNVHFPDAAVQKEFVEWLEKKGVGYEIVKSRGVDHVVWNEAAGNLVRDFVKSRATARPPGR
jgi:hypothetical protein